MFLSFDGVDGCGKTSISKRVAFRLEQSGFQVVKCRDPGSTALGDSVRDLLLNRKELNILPLSELFLFMSARTQMVQELIRPAIERNNVVICDRFVLSSIAYQGYGGGIPVPLIEQLGRIATLDTVPDITFVLDVPYEIALKRMGNRTIQDRMEAKGEDYQKKVRAGFLKCAQSDPKKFVLIDASQSPEEIEQEVWNILEQRFKIKR